MDVFEFFNMLMDRIETQLKGSKDPDLIKKHFGGNTTIEIISKVCNHHSEREEPFLAVNLQVKNMKNIEQSLQSMIQGEVLDGDNAYQCEKCDKKITAVRRMCLKKLPNHLILVLKRFEFDYDTMQK